MVRHLTLSLLMANVIPGVLFYVCLVTGNIWAAFASALLWCYGAMAWRITTGRPRSALLWLTAAGLTAKTLISVSTGSTLIYFLQPAVNDLLIGTAFLVSLGTARPIVARLAADFFPMSQDIESRPRVQQLFWRLTLLWAVLCLLKAGVTLWLLHAESITAFVATKGLLTFTVLVFGTATTVFVAHRVARGEGLMHTRPAPVVAG
ncbi:MAG: VC0807 family protein [Actinomycetales bacterium]